ncbi:MAG: ATP synthase F1 subunit gamma [Dehalococcoidia bacterium]|nr:ATP synthase F1 subunit gamma [Chloroflexota bacterium]MCH2525715.1 ATP synthase F1 subunit gamma [Dehalococcoidia bacterium]MQF99983.1 ATP synthase F1 subunit gamma [SAR202 cluster bacterium]
MANIRTIRNRIRSVQNTAKVTRAMEMIAASKMRRSQQRLTDSRPYADTISQIIGHITAQSGDLGDDVHPLMEQREVRKIRVVHITPDRGLCGGLNGNLNRNLGRFVAGLELPLDSVIVGRKGRDFASRSGIEVRSLVMDIGDTPTLSDTQDISEVVIEDYRSGKVDEVYVSYSKFMSTVLQVPTIKKLLPVEPIEVEDGNNSGYIYEPNANQVLDSLLPKFVEVQIYQAILENIGSEHSARMVAMSSATDSANEMIQDLTLLMNKVRQASITTELLDIVGGVAALEG